MTPTTKDAHGALSAADVMTAPVVTVAPTAEVREAARVMLAGRISGVPVVSESGELLGIVSECDLLRRADPGRAAALTVRDVMSAPAVTVRSETPLREIAELMLSRRINRVPVVDDGRIVGIVARADVLRGFVRPDESVAAAVRQLLRDGVRIDLSHLRFWVRGGVVSLEGVLGTRCERELARRAVEAIDGVIQVDDRTTTLAQG